MHANVTHARRMLVRADAHVHATRRLSAAEALCALRGIHVSVDGRGRLHGTPRPSTFLHDSDGHGERYLAMDWAVLCCVAALCDDRTA